MPPIAGVSNGAMILQDTLFSSISFETMKKQLQPKVDGSTVLDELFQDNDLDFFILFGSISGVTGNQGQSAYAAANAYMASLIHRRKKRGLVGSIINPAAIAGVGYITRTDEGLLDDLGSRGFGVHSEQDVHQFFAEAVLAGEPHSERNPEISAGLQPFNLADPNAPTWVRDPKYSHYWKRDEGSSEGRLKSNLTVKAQLLEEVSMEGVYQLIIGM